VLWKDWVQVLSMFSGPADQSGHLLSGRNGKICLLKNLRVRREIWLRQQKYQKMASLMTRRLPRALLKIPKVPPRRKAKMNSKLKKCLLGHSVQHNR